MERARGAIRALMDLAPAVALVRRDGAEQGAADRRGPRGRHRRSCGLAKRSRSTVALRPGQSHVNQAPVTGESLPVEKTPGDEVFGGTINGRARARRPGRRACARDSTLARIIHLVEQAQAQRAPSQTLRRSVRAHLHAGRARPRRPGRARSAGARAGHAGASWIYRALVLLVISCPCALVISTPGVDRFGACGCRAQRRADQGRRAPRAARGRAMRGVRQDRHADQGSAPRRRRDRRSTARHRERVLQLAASLESAVGASDRPRDRRARGSGRAFRSSRSDAFESLPGRGAEARRRHDPRPRRQPSAVRGARLCSPRARRPDRDAAGRRLNRRSSSALRRHGARDDRRRRPRARIRARRSAAAARAGRPHVVLLTGDHEAAARALAAAARDRRCAARAAAGGQGRPRSRSCGRRYGAVAMVGDGINDAPGARRGRRRHRDGRGGHATRRSRPPTSR